HRFPASPERVHEALGLLPEHLAALVEPLAGVTLGLTGPLLGTLGDTLGEEVTRFPAATWCGQERDSGAERSSEQEPPEIAAAVLLISYDCTTSRLHYASFR